MRPNVNRPMRTHQYAEMLAHLHEMRGPTPSTATDLALGIMVLVAKREPRHVDYDVLEPIAYAAERAKVGDEHMQRVSLQLARALLDGDPHAGMEAVRDLAADAVPF